MVKKLLMALVTGPMLLQAQPPQEWDQTLLTGIVWSFQMTFEAGKGDIIEKADTSFICDLLFDEGHSYELFDRDQLVRGMWDLRGDRLSVSFRGLKEFTLVQLTPDQLDLQFQAGRKYYIHRFLRQTSILPIPSNQANQFPNFPIPQKPEKRTWPDEEREIRVELTGGGFFGGNDPVQRDFILIKENGRLIHERQTAKTGLNTDKTTLSMRQLAELADFIRSNGFFEMEPFYGCRSPECENRLQQQPVPVPLRLAVSDGLDRHVVEVAVWDENTTLVSFPPGLKRIVDQIRRMAD